MNYPQDHDPVGIATGLAMFAGMALPVLFAACAIVVGVLSLIGRGF